MIKTWPCGLQATGFLVPKGQAESGTIMLSGLSLRIRLSFHRIKTSTCDIHFPVSDIVVRPGCRSCCPLRACCPELSSQLPRVQAPSQYGCVLSSDKGAATSQAPALTLEGPLFTGKHIQSKIPMSLRPSIPATSQMCILT